MFLFGIWQKDHHTQLNKSSYERLLVLNVKVFTNSNKEKILFYTQAFKNKINVHIPRFN